MRFSSEMPEAIFYRIEFIVTNEDIISVYMYDQHEHPARPGNF